MIALLWAVLCAVALADDGFLFYDEFRGTPYNVTYDKRSYMLNGRRTLFVSGSVHYPRFSVGSWESVLKKAKADGANLIQTYTFWNYHQPTEGSWVWSDNANLTQFIEKCGELGLFVNLRLGPYVCAEWTYGGLPVWTMEKPGMKVRSYNDVYITEAEKYMQHVVNEVRHLFADRGGPIVLGQTENELSTQDDKYVEWCGDVVTKMVPSVPWVMCNGRTSSKTVNACDGDDCAAWLERHGQNGRVMIDQPAMWAENEGWFQLWGEPNPCYQDSPEGCRFASRTIPDLSYRTLRFYARGACHNNYYMYLGGNNYGKSGSASMTTWYAELVNFHSDSHPNEPRYTHMHRLHELLRRYSLTLLEDSAQYDHKIKLPWWDGSKWEEGTQQYAFEYHGNNGFLAFIENEAEVTVKTKYGEKEFVLAPSSIVAVDRSLSVVYNTSAIPTASSRRTYRSLDLSLSWSAAAEDIVRSTDRPVVVSKLQDALHLMQMETQYLSYQRQVTLKSNSELILQGMKGAAFVIYVDGEYITTLDNYEHYEGSASFKAAVEGHAGIHNLTILLESFGISDGIYPGHPKVVMGLTQVKLDGSDLSSVEWSHKIGLWGETQKWYTAEGAAKAPWKPYSASTSYHTQWFKTEFVLPSLPSSSEVEFSVRALGRGHAYINGRDLGRYWSIQYKPGNYTQEFYHIPRDWMKSSGVNLLVISEITGPVDLTKFQLVSSQMEVTN